LRFLRSLWRPSLHLALATGLLAPLGGCTRYFFRKQADKEVSEVLGNKDKYAAWKIDNWHIYPDPRARFAEVGCPDRPAKPPDDPAAYDMSPNPQHPYKAGVARMEGTGYLNLIAMWDKENRERKTREAEEEKKKEEPPTAAENGDKAKTPPGAEPKPGPATEQPAAASKEGAPGTGNVQTSAEYAPPDAIAEAKERSLLDITDRPGYLLTLDQAAELAMFNSREYQDQRENLYLAALPVTQQRFSFAAQLFAAQEATRGYYGRNTPGGQRNNWTLNNGTGFSKILPTGALLLLNFSNQTVFNFFNPKNITSVTNLDFSIVQPFLQGGGKAVALESLTQAERNLLYQIRTFARFRKQLYVEVASNNGGSINGGSFQPSSVLSNNNGANNNIVSTGNLGPSGLVPGVIPSAAVTINSAILPPASPGTLALAPAITPTPSGYLNTMLQKIQVYIDQENIDVLSNILLRFRGLLEGDVVGPLQVQSVEQQLLTGRATLLLDQQQYLGSINAFKLELGIPMKVEIEMDDSQLQPLIKQYRLARSVIENEQAAVAAAADLIPLEKAPRLRAELKNLFLKSAVVKGTKFADSIRGRWGAWEKLSNQDLAARLAGLAKETQQLLDLQADLQKQGKNLSQTDHDRLIELGAQRDLGFLERALRQYEAAYVDDKGQPKKQDAAGERQRIRMFQSVVSSWQKVLVVARDEQWQKVRSSWPDLPRCCLKGVDLVNDNLAQAEAAAAQYALENRFDLMNVRAQVVDAWRQLAVYANSLLGVFNVGYNLHTNSPLNVAQPTNIGGSGTSNVLTLNTQLPLVRIQERNNYRASLIAFTRQRRTLQEAEDLTVQAVYNEIFSLRLFAEQYKVQKRQLELAYLTIDSSLESLQAPTAPPPLPGQARTGQDGPAALTQQLLNAQRTLPLAQNALLTIWISYLDFRLQLYRDLELMPLDARGVWIDQIKECECSLDSKSSSGAGEPSKGSDGKADAKPEQLPAPQKVPPEPPQPPQAREVPGEPGKGGDSKPEGIPEMLPEPQLIPAVPPKLPETLQQMSGALSQGSSGTPDRLPDKLPPEPEEVLPVPPKPPEAEELPSAPVPVETKKVRHSAVKVRKDQESSGFLE